MINAILCEGATDSILLSYLLVNQGTWKYEKKPPKNFNMFVGNDVLINWYRRDDDYTLIASVNGKNGFLSFFQNNIYQLLINYEKSFDKLIYIRDKDQEEIGSVLREISSNLSPIDIDSAKLENNKWYHANFLDSFKVNKSIDILPLIIPEDKNGALEEVLMDALSENKEYKIIIDNSKSFVISMKEKSISSLRKNRFIPKAQLSVSFGIISPSKCFTLLDEIIKTVKWEKFEVIKNLFNSIINL